jgi:hypothetical protein
MDAVQPAPCPTQYPKPQTASMVWAAAASRTQKQSPPPDQEGSCLAQRPWCRLLPHRQLAQVAVRPTPRRVTDKATAHAPGTMRPVLTSASLTSARAYAPGTIYRHGLISARAYASLVSARAYASLISARAYAPGRLSPYPTAAAVSLPCLPTPRRRLSPYPTAAAVSLPHGGGCLPTPRRRLSPYPTAAAVSLPHGTAPETRAINQSPVASRQQVQKGGGGGTVRETRAPQSVPRRHTPARLGVVGGPPSTSPFPLSIASLFPH